MLHYNFFSKLREYFILPKMNKGVKTNFLAYPIILKKNKRFSKKNLQIFLEKNNIQTRPIFTGNILRHPAFAPLTSNRNKLNNFKCSDYIMRNGLLIGCHQGLSSKNVFQIHKMITKFLKSKKIFF